MIGLPGEQEGSPGSFFVGSDDWSDALRPAPSTFGERFNRYFTQYLQEMGIILTKFSIIITIKLQIEIQTSVFDVKREYGVSYEKE